ncbi:DNA/RNA non-specific endonuclease [Corynebacterium sp. AOP12-C2-36]|uniref:DNA/RNA non-specific endonuclease n=1 Tax=Corynebacterium sp. AOP12-C2-36 TaxID=3457723 RepID=UPI0040332A46
MSKSSKKTLASITAAIIAAAGIAIGYNTDAVQGTVDEWLGGGDSVAATVDQGNDYYTVTGTAQRDFSTIPGSVEYCEPDALSRAMCAYGELTSDTRAAAKERGRQSINVDPVGWGHNDEVDIPALDGVTGSQHYHGWMYNRSHLLADSLGGSPEQVNLVTGTRGQNVGSVGNSGGMAYTETIARDYLDGNTGADANACPLYYAASPNYTGSELLPRTVTVDIQSCDQSIDQRVTVDNTAAGHTIDYTTGAFN